MTGHKKSNDYLHQERHDRLLREWDHDPYHSKLKIQDPSVCTDCGAVFHKGRWQWGGAPADARQAVCPACHRIKERVPAGILTIQGEFFSEHEEEIMHLVHNTEAAKKNEHPLQRIMAIEDTDEGRVITFTDPHLARAVGEALHHAYKGELDFHYTEEDVLLRLSWRR